MGLVEFSTRKIYAGCIAWNKLKLRQCLEFAPHVTGQKKHICLQENTSMINVPSGWKSIKLEKRETICMYAIFIQEKVFIAKKNATRKLQHSEKAKDPPEIR